MTLSVLKLKIEQWDIELWTLVAIAVAAQLIGVVFIGFGVWATVGGIIAGSDFTGEISFGLVIYFSYGVVAFLIASGIAWWMRRKLSSRGYRCLFWPGPVVFCAVALAALI